MYRTVLEQLECIDSLNEEEMKPGYKMVFGVPRKIGGSKNTDNPKVKVSNRMNRRHITADEYTNGGSKKSQARQDSPDNDTKLKEKNEKLSNVQSQMMDHFDTFAPRLTYGSGVNHGRYLVARVFMSKMFGDGPLKKIVDKSFLDEKDIKKLKDAMKAKMKAEMSDTSTSHEDKQNRYNDIIKAVQNQARR